MSGVYANFFIHYCMNNEEIATADQLLDLMKINPMIKNQELFPKLDMIFEILAVTEKKNRYSLHR